MVHLDTGILFAYLKGPDKSVARHTAEYGCARGAAIV